jgi:hypothetical protein
MSFRALDDIKVRIFKLLYFFEFDIHLTFQYLFLGKCSNSSM